MALGLPILTTGEMTVALLHRLLLTHPNLFLQLRIPPHPGDLPQNTPLDASGKIRPDWPESIRAFPDRFVLGSDTFIARPDFAGGVRLTGSLRRQLPADLARKVGVDNTVSVYKLR